MNLKLKVLAECLADARVQLADWVDKAEEADKKVDYLRKAVAQLQELVTSEREKGE